jgi:adenylate cyclase
MREVVSQPATCEVKTATILFADLRGFTALTAGNPPQLVFDLLNRCFVRMSEVIVAHGGTIDKFMGDAIMVVFSDAGRAVACAVEMQLAMDTLNREHRKTGLPELYMGIGINTGTVLAGRIGSELYSALTVIGEEVNVAARIEAFCLRGQILVSEATFALCRELSTGKPVELFVKGSESGVTVHEVLGTPGKTVPRQERRRSPRVDVRLPFFYQHLASGVVSPQRAKGTILDIGYYGVRAVVEREIGLYSELKLELDLPLVDYKASDTYGRIVNSKPDAGRHCVGIEFTTLSPEASRRIQHLVQMLMTIQRPKG